MVDKRFRDKYLLDDSVTFWKDVCYIILFYYHNTLMFFVRDERDTISFDRGGVMMRWNEELLEDKAGKPEQDK